MAPVVDLERECDEVVLDSKGHYRVTLNADGKPIAASFDGNTVKIENCNDSTIVENLGNAVLVTAPPV